MPAKGKSVFIHRIALEDFEAWIEPVSFQGDGQPVYVGDTFWGVAYPSAQNLAANGRVSCSYLVGKKIGPEGYISEPAVLGVAKSGKVRDAFFEYVDKIRARKVSSFLLWNTWYDLRNFSQAEVISGIEGLKKNLTGPYGVKIDSVVLDDGWDDFNKLWQPHEERFPNGFAKVSEAAKGTGAKLGLWMSPVGGYAINHNLRILGTLFQGYEKNLTGFCFAGETYKNTFRDRMRGYMRDYGANYYKLDNLNTTCNHPFHGHRVGEYGQVGLTDAFIEILESVRKENPDVMINFTVGSWLSPWWLEYADVIWRGGMDYGSAGSGSARQRSITYVDKILYKRYHKERSQFPISSLMTHGVIKGKYQSFGEAGENLRDFADDVWMYHGRGVMMWELYLTPSMLSDAEWNELAKAIKWSRENQRLLARSEMALGDPEAGEVYGFFHEHEDERLLVLRNPGEKAQPLPTGIPALVPELAGASGEVFGCQVVYSSDKNSPTDPLTGFEVRILHCGREAAGGGGVRLKNGCTSVNDN